MKTKIGRASAQTAVLFFKFHSPFSLCAGLAANTQKKLGGAKNRTRSARRRRKKFRPANPASNEGDLIAGAIFHCPEEKQNKKKTEKTKQKTACSTHAPVGVASGVAASISRLAAALSDARVRTLKHPE